jgi:hypothetical protein
MSVFSPFINEFGTPKASTGVAPAALGLEGFEELGQFAQDAGTGIFRDGLVSFCSTREIVDGLGAWSAWIPNSPRLFGSTAFGTLFVTSNQKDIWLIDTQYGQVVESDFTLTDFANAFADPEIRDEYLKPELFSVWQKMGGELPDDSVLVPTPMIPLGGNWAASSLSPSKLSVYISITGQLFAPGSGMPAEVRRLA